MTETFKEGMLATIGPGIKIAQFEVENPGTEGATINAKDIGLSTIVTLQANTVQLNAAVALECAVGIGTFLDGIGDANYATVRVHNSGGTTSANLGTIQVTAIGI